MSSQTKILVLHRRIFIYALLALIGLLTIVAVIYFSSQQMNQNQINTAASFYDMDDTQQLASSATYIPGIYSSSIKLGDSQFEVCICLDENHINSIQLKPTDETISTMYPLLNSTMDELSSKIIESQSIENISYSTEYRYTNLTILTAIQQTLNKAKK